MKQWTSLVLSLACVLCLAASACRGREPGGKQAGGKSSGESPNAHVAKFKLGHEFDKQGEAAREGRTFAKGDKVYVTFAILDAQRDAQARVVWVTKSGVKVAEETKPLPRGDGVVAFTADTKSWESGTYVVETRIVEPGDVGARRLGTADFTVAGSPAK